MVVTEDMRKRSKQLPPQYRSHSGPCFNENVQRLDVGSHEFFRGKKERGDQAVVGHNHAELRQSVYRTFILDKDGQFTGELGQDAAFQILVVIQKSV
jgi:hypothetical protein